MGLEEISLDLKKHRRFLKINKRTTNLLQKEKTLSNMMLP